MSCAILIPVALMRREPLPSRRDVLEVAAYGVLWLAIYSTTLNGAERTVDAGTAAMLINTGPILIAILAGIFLHEGFPAGLFAGCAVAFAGATLIAFGGTTSRTGSGVGIVLCVIAALAYALAVVVQKPALERVTSFQVTWLGVVAATIACLPFAPELFNEAPKAGAAAIRLDDLPRRCTDCARLRDVVLRPRADERGPYRFAQLPDPGRCGRSRLGDTARDTAASRTRGRRAVHRGGVHRPPATRDSAGTQELELAV